MTDLPRIEDGLLVSTVFFNNVCANSLIELMTLKNRGGAIYVGYMNRGLRYRHEIWNTDSQNLATLI